MSPGLSDSERRAVEIIEAAERIEARLSVDEVNALIRPSEATGARLSPSEPEPDPSPREWRETRWWRAVGPDGELWCESSDQEEVREHARPDDRVQVLMEEIPHRRWEDRPVI